jgi:hypothetical protein
MSEKKKDLITQVIVGEGQSLGAAQEDLETKIESVGNAMKQDLSQLKPEIKYIITVYAKEKKIPVMVTASQYKEAKEIAEKALGSPLTADLKQLVKIEHTYQIEKEVVQEAKTKGKGSPAGPRDKAFRGSESYSLPGSRYR